MLELLQSHFALIIGTLLLGGFLIRLTMCLPSYDSPRRGVKSKNGNVSTMVIWGSGKVLIDAAEAFSDL